jgi:hypothetical protein
MSQNIKLSMRHLGIANSRKALNNPIQSIDKEVGLKEVGL